ncbi:SPFH domain-containing protein [Sphaerisporangium sp. TRM90804]|uniref:SPFH domain-containing protein n=1 Tax=Sphaerisporangium sp. TRM90804 TaxID=3031113 RepID=UPI0024493543|nr:SPFH domain-containing protein [Sphaerisporangium sp. TRM90804]MDH2425132.1 SPFH domain-containing protein [Sphaerisporangium sp. TRM90804]
MSARKDVDGAPGGRGRRLAIRGVLLGVIAVVLLGIVASCSTKISTAPDEVRLHYAGGPFEPIKFVKCVNPSSGATFLGPGDTSYPYPFGQRTFDFSGVDDSESKPISIVSKDNVELQVAGSATFTLNTSCTTLRQFHEKIGLKYGAYLEDEERTSSGWRRMLNFYFKQPLDRAMDAASQEFEWKKLFNDPNAKQQWEQRVGQLARQFIKETAGADYFCQPNFAGVGDCGDVVLTIQKPEPPRSLIDALAAEQAAKQQNLAQQQINTKVKTELESIKDLVEVLGPQGAILWKAVQDGRVQVVPVPQNGSVNITPQTR